MGWLTEWWFSEVADNTVYECRHCGMTLDHGDSRCPYCGPTEVVTFEF
ncbi:hypothetical protein [Haladaptatus sp. YSMS36]|nr:hypothetical protein [Haladaptatus sp. YSMS36]